MGRRSAGYHDWLLLLWLLVPTGLVFLFSQLRPVYRPKYLFEVLPTLPLLAGVGLARLPRAAGLACFGVLAGLSLLAAGDNFRMTPPDDYRRAVAYARAQARPGDGRVFISKWNQNAFEYYAGWHWGRNPAAPYADVLEPFDWAEVADFRSYWGLRSPAALAAFAAEHPRIWLVQAYHGDPMTRTDAAAPVRAHLERQGYVLHQQGFNRAQLLLYERPTGGATGAAASVGILLAGHQ